jgi:predicted RNase H-like HicB family nuclease
MSDGLWVKAEELAKRGYSTEFEVDVMPDEMFVYMARNPELPGCKAQGDSVDEAQANLDEVRIDYINALLEENIPVPEPRNLSSNTNMRHELESATVRTFSFDEDETEQAEMDTILDKVIQPNYRHFKFGIELGGDLVKHG